jgi:acetyl-CoA C-acetyltransferase
VKEQEVYLCGALRTAIGRMGGALADLPAERLAALVIRELLARSRCDAGLVDEVILGQTKQSSDAPNVARVAALAAGLPEAVPACTVHRQCGSGLQAINSGVQQILSGYAGLVIAGGVESMSTAPYYLRNARFGYRAGNAELLDPNTESQPRSQPEELYGRLTMGLTAENLAAKYGISREEQDRFAFSSQQRARRAIAEGCFGEEIVPVVLPQKKGPPLRFDTDEHPRALSLDELAKLPPVFKENGTVTAGNSSGRNDGAAAVILASAKTAAAAGLKPLARVLSHAVAGVSPACMGIGPVPATRKALERAGLSLAEIDLLEVNEAFAAQYLAVDRELKLDPEKVNVNGGAIALGHPLGCTGARLMTTLLYEMKRRRSRRGLVTMCIGGGMGITTVIEAV